MTMHQARFDDINNTEARTLLGWWAVMAEQVRAAAGADDEGWCFTDAVERANGRLRGEWAELRRAQSLSEVVQTAAYQRLRHVWEAASLPKTAKRDGTPDWAEDRLAAVAWVLSQVKGGSGKSLGRSFGTRAEKSERGVVSEIRFRQLLECTDRAELCRHLHRLLGILGGKANPLELAELAYWWSADERGDRLRRKLANSYYMALLSINTEQPSN